MRVKKQQFERSTSLKRKKVPLESKEPKKERKNFSRPKTLVSSPEDKGLDAIKNSIMRIKEKALSGEEPKDTTPTEQRHKNYLTSIKAHVTVSSIHLGNLKPTNDPLEMIEKLKAKTEKDLGMIV